MDVAAIAKIAFTSDDRVRDVIRNFKKIAKSRPADHDLPFSTWSLSKLAEFLVAEGVVDDISHEGLRALLREEDGTFQRLKTWKAADLNALRASLRCARSNSCSISK
jgi:hypothetical protein